MIISDLAGEESIAWVADPAGLPYVRQSTAYAGTRRRGVRWDFEVAGYAVLRRDAPAMPGAPGTFERRVFWLKDYDRARDPDGTYRTGCPSEGVDPLTVAPGVPGEITARAWNCAGHGGAPHGGPDGCDLCGAPGRD